MKDEPKTHPQSQDNAAESELSASACYLPFPSIEPTVESHEGYTIVTYKNTQLEEPAPMPKIPPHMLRKIKVMKRKKWVMKQLERLPFFR